MVTTKVKVLQTYIVLLVLLTYGCHSTEAKLLAMRPLSARQVYRLLHEYGRMDAVPQGRVITQGLAAMTGFALGLTKGLGGALLFDIITANVTAADLESAVNGGSSSTANGAFTTEEVCFNSRSARSLEEAEAVAEAYSRNSDQKKEKRKVRLSEVERRTTLKRRDKRRKKSKKRPSRLVLGKQSTNTVTGGDGGGDGTATATATATANPTATATATAGTNPTTATTGTGTNVDNGQGTGTTSTSTTQTSPGGAMNCVVIQKPATG